jgi:glycosyltransferase involved in cell wall biosynthesis
MGPSASGCRMSAPAWHNAAVSPRVSVVIATYNWSPVLPYSIGSVLAQTFPDFEVLVVGDGCTDDSAAVVAAIGDPRVRWINLPANTGHQSGPNNEGLHQARGEVIAYLGHDDLWFPHHLEAALNALDEEKADLACTLVAAISPDGRSVQPIIPQPKRRLFSIPSGSLHRRAVTSRIGGWRDYRGLRVSPEIDLFRRAADAGFRFAFVARLGVIKFSASSRKDVYRIRPCHEQAAWTARMRAEPGLEAQLLSRIILEGGLTNVAYRDLVRHVAGEAVRRLTHPSLARFRRGGQVDVFKKYKGTP